MFDVSWSELLVVGLVALVVVGPKELPRFLNTLGKYAGIVKRQANEFRSVFEQAMREAEMEEIRKEVNAVKDGVKASLDDATRTVESVKSAAKVDDQIAAKPADPPKAIEDKSEDSPTKDSPTKDSTTNDSAAKDAAQVGSVAVVSAAEPTEDRSEVQPVQAVEASSPPVAVDDEAETSKPKAGAA